MTAGTTTFDPRPEYPSGVPITIPTRNVVDSRSKTGANDSFSTPDVSWIPNRAKSKAYGDLGSYIDTGDPRGRDIHGGGSRLKDPFLPKQGWAPTMGCTRGQNEDVRDLGKAINDFKLEYPGVKVPYFRHK